jgi:NifU-like protein involved in Fe-S cluster formation
MILGDASSTGSAAPQDERILYTTEILRLAASLPIVGIVTPHGSGEARAVTCGSRVQTAVTLDGDRVAAVSQRVQACAFGQASAALVQAGAVGRTRGEIADARAVLGEWLSGGRESPGNWPGLAALSPARSRTGRHGAMVLPFDALLAALDDAAKE